MTTAAGVDAGLQLSMTSTMIIDYKNSNITEYGGDYLSWDKFPSMNLAFVKFCVTLIEQASEEWYIFLSNVLTDDSLANVHFFRWLQTRSSAFHVGPYFPSCYIVTPEKLGINHIGFSLVNQ